MIGKTSLLLASAALLGMMTGAALADGKNDCTKETQAKWKKQEDAEATAKAAGYQVSRSKVIGSCYEVYAVKDGKNLELFYDPVELKLLQTVVK